MNEIGFMQGRLSPIVDGKIQAFPWDHWKEEIVLAAQNNFFLMEWTLDQDRLYENPFMTKEGQTQILGLKMEYRFSIPSLTGDCYMQAPFYKTRDIKTKNNLQKDFDSILESCLKIGVKYVVMPLVDNGRMENREHENSLVDFLISRHQLLKRNKQCIVFECDYIPKEYKRFIDRLPRDCFGINYDIGNSASLDIPPSSEFSLYGDRILNVHIKDRLKGGTTVALGSGNADFNEVFNELKKINYRGNFILQTARANDGEHVKALVNYRSFLKQYTN